MSESTPNEYPVDLTAPDIAPYRNGNTGIDFITTFNSGKPGPHVMLSAVVHGNELCGAITLDNLFSNEIRPLHGMLTLGFINVDAYHTFDPKDPTTSRYVDEDFNRLWTTEVLDGPRDSVELKRAREIRPIIDTVDYLLDIHSMQTSTVPLMMAGPLAKGRSLAHSIGIPETVVTDAGHAAGKRMRDYAGFSDPDSEKNSLLVECGQHWDKSSADLAIQVAYRFLYQMEMIDGDTASAHQSESSAVAQKFIEVTGPYTIQTDECHFTDKYVGLEVIPKKGTIIAHDGETPVTTPYDDCVLIMPSRRLKKGESAVRFGQFIEP